MEKMLSLGEVAERLGLSSESIRQFIHAGKLTGFRVGPRKIVVSETEVEKYLESSKCEVSKEKEIISDV